MNKLITRNILVCFLCGLFFAAGIGCGVASGAEVKNANKASATSKTATKKSVKPDKETEKKDDIIKNIAYYFHGTARCYTCKKIEAYSEEAIKSGFPTELKDGKLEWLVVNVEEKPNQHFIQDYQLYTKSLVLAQYRNGSQVKWKNLDKIWENVRDKDVFVKYVRDEVALFIKDESGEKKSKPAKEEK